MVSNVIAKQPNVISFTLIKIEILLAFVGVCTTLVSQNGKDGNRKRLKKLPFFGDRLAIVPCNECTCIRKLYLDFKQIQ